MNYYNRYFQSHLISLLYVWVFWLVSVSLLAKVNCGLMFMMQNKELPLFFTEKTHESYPTFALFPEFEHVFSSMEMAVFALLRH